VLKGKVPSQDILNKMVSVARSVNGATSVDTSQVTIG
jgi:osmotically-inducible protein OsmY